MTQNEFLLETEKLENYFEKKYTPEQIKIIYDELKKMRIEKYKLIVKNLIRENKFLPKLSEMINLDNEIQISDNKEQGKIKCEKCNGTGYIIYTKSVDNGGQKIQYQYGAICSCGNAKQYRGWEHNDEQHKTNFYTPYASELGL